MISLLMMGRQWGPLDEGLGNSDTQVGKTMYCDAIRKKDEVTKQISTRSPQPLCTKSLERALHAHQLLLLNGHHRPETHPLKYIKFPWVSSAFCNITAISGIRVI